jgi:Na+/H+-dicarboxylate symporter
MKLKLHWQILIAMAMAWLFHLLLGESSRIVEPLGVIFIRLLKMVIIPLVVLSIITGVAGVGNSKKLGRLGIKTLAYYLGTSLLAIVLGLILVNLIQPGKVTDLPLDLSFSSDQLHKPDSPLDVLIRMVPVNPFAAAVEGDMLGLIFFSILMGFGITLVSQPVKEKILPPIEAAFEVVMQVVHVIIRLAPVGVFGLIVRMLNQDLGTAFFKAVGLYMVTITVGLSIHFLIVLPLIYYLFLRKNPLDQFRHMASALATVFATSSSLAALPVTMECVEDNIGVPNRVAGFVLPLGATINMDGTALFECVGVLFIAQVMGIHLGVEQQLLVVLTALLASIGAAAVPSSGLVMIFIVLEAVGIQGEMVGVIVGTMLAVDRPLDMYRGLVNIFSDSVGAVIIARSEGEELRPKED